MNHPIPVLESIGCQNNIKSRTILLYLHESSDHAIFPIARGRIFLGPGFTAGDPATTLDQETEEVVYEVEGGRNHAGSVLGQHLVPLILPDNQLKGRVCRGAVQK